MKYFVLIKFFLVTSFLAGYSQTQLEKSAKSLAEQISKNLIDNNKRVIAVVDFSYFEDKITAFDKILTEELVTQLFLIENAQFEIVERGLLKKTLNEQKLSLSGLLEPSDRMRIGQALSADAIVTGSVSDLIEKLKVNARLIDVTTGRIFAVAAADIPNTGLIKKLHNTVLGTGLPPADNPRIKKTEFTQVVDGISVTFISGKYTNDRLVCELNFTADRDVDIQLRKPKLIDSNGNTYLVAFKWVGNLKSTGNHYPHTLLVENNKTPVKLDFHNVSKKPKSIALVSIPLEIDGTDFEIRIKGMPVK